LSLTIILKEEKKLISRKVYNIFDLLEDFGGILGSFEMILSPLATYSGILMTNFLLNTYFVHVDKSKVVPLIAPNYLKNLKPFGYTFLRYMCSKTRNSTRDRRFLALREKGENHIQ
jgi:hypothetical protein